MQKKPRILVVDDGEENLELMRAILVPCNYEVILARDGEEALEQVTETSPDVILLNVNMPRIDGVTVARRLKSDDTTRSIPIVMVTALDEVDHRIEAFTVGVDDFLSKPIDVVELTARVRSLVKVKAYHDHLPDYQRELEQEVARRTALLHKAHEKLKGASLDTIYRLSRAAEFRDAGTGAYIQRISHYAAAISRRMGLNETTVEGILYAAPMHDVGKIGIPDRILLKPGKLDFAEWEIMKQHTIMGGRILEGASRGFIELARVIALTHHERWDGSGYPKGLKGSKTPLAGRITALADVFDALTSKRPYKEPFSTKESFTIIHEGRGSHFDPAVVDALLAIQGEILAIKEKYQDPQAKCQLHFFPSAFEP
jgi:putative two-component system response regulator